MPMSQQSYDNLASVYNSLLTYNQAKAKNIRKKH